MLGTTKIYGCLADPIVHVKAPPIFTSVFKEKNKFVFYGFSNFLINKTLVIKVIQHNIPKIYAI